MKIKIEELSIEECYVVASCVCNLSNFIFNEEGVNSMLAPVLTGLIKRLKLEIHAKRVVKAFILKNIKKNKLTLITTNKYYRHPFCLPIKLKKNFKEDEIVAQHMIHNIYDDELTIDISRCRIANKTDLIKIIKCILFGTQSKKFIIPNKIEVPDYITIAINEFKLLDFFIDAFNISKEELRLILSAYITDAVSEMTDFCYFFDVGNIDNEVFYTNMKYRIFQMCLNISLPELKELLRPDRKLVSLGLIDPIGHLFDITKQCIAVKSVEPFFVNIFQEVPINNTFDMTTFSINQEHSDLALQFLKNNLPTNILLYGMSGVGKTEFAKSLAKKTGLKLFVFQNELENKIDTSSKDPLYRLECILAIKKNDSIFLIDNAENILKTKDVILTSEISNSQKGSVNKMLENNVNKVIWIVNYIDSIDNSTLRRFNYSIKFNEMPKELFQSITKSKLQTISIKGKLLDNLVDLCGSYHVTGASIDNVIKTVESIGVSKNNEEKILADVKNILEANSELLFGTSKIRKKINGQYDSTALNTSISTSEIVTMIKNAVEYSKQTEIKAGIRMLFFGASGTGKTAFAWHISESLGKPLILKKASDVLGKYIGENESNIKRAFQEASDQDAILLFDEADSFFTNRLDAEHSWERTLVNEFLVQMEDFNGLLICTTNMKELMDPAMYRRFHIMTEFKALNVDGIKALLPKYFGSLVFSSQDIQRLEKQNSLTPGDFNALYGRVRFMSKENLTGEYIVSELLKMQEEKQCTRKIGFIY